MSIPPVWADVAAVLSPDVSEVKPDVYADDDGAAAVVASAGVGVTSRLATSGIGGNGVVAGCSCLAARLLLRDKLWRSDNRADGREGISEERENRWAG